MEFLFYKLTIPRT